MQPATHQNMEQRNCIQRSAAPIPSQTTAISGRIMENRQSLSAMNSDRRYDQSITYPVREQDPSTTLESVYRAQQQQQQFMQSSESPTNPGSNLMNHQYVPNQQAYAMRPISHVYGRSGVEPGGYQGVSSHHSAPVLPYPAPALSHSDFISRIAANCLLLPPPQSLIAPDPVQQQKKNNIQSVHVNNIEQMEHLLATKSELENRIKQLQFEKEKQKSEMQATIVAHNCKVESFETCLQSVQQEKDNLFKSLSDMATFFKETLENLDQIVKDRESVFVKNEELRKAIELRKSQVQTLTSSNNAFKCKEKELIRKIQDANDQCNEKNQSINELNAEIQILKNNKKLLALRFAVERSRASEAADENSELFKKLSVSENELQGSRKYCENLTQEILDEKSKVNELQNELDSIKLDMDNRDHVINDLENQLRQTKALVEELQREKLIQQQDKPKIEVNQPRIKGISPSAMTPQTKFFEPKTENNNNRTNVSIITQQKRKQDQADLDKQLSPGKRICRAKNTGEKPEMIDLVSEEEDCESDSDSDVGSVNDIFRYDEDD